MPTDQQRQGVSLRRLSNRQEQVLKLIAIGYRTKQIAYMLRLKEETISIHLRAARKNLGARTTPHAVWLYANIILTPRDT
ncbi:MAG: helix-turn-helix transcriptional regulator [Pseudomonadota bacterium]